MSVLIAVVVFAWIAIALLGLAVGGLLAQVRALDARLGPPAVDPARVVPRLRDDASVSIPPGAYAAVFVDSTCDVCHDAITELMANINGGPLLVVTDEMSPQWPPLPSGVRAVIDSDALDRSGVPVVPWFAAVDDSGQTTESFALGNSPSIERAAQIIQKLNTPAAGRSQEVMQEGLS
jgi:hypothetical protein